ncbi:MAG: GNAT family N-acetyltransferase [Bryobacteraceae bacterium]
MTGIRPGRVGDLSRVLEIQAQSPPAAHWDPIQYLDYHFRVAEAEGRVVAFLVARPVYPGEWEILNLATEPAHRRRGFARCLLLDLLRSGVEAAFLEVRESNYVARELYKSLKFIEVNIRKDYYRAPPESAIVLKFHSC